MQTPIHYRTIVALGQAIRTGELSSSAITEHFLHRIDALDSKLGGVHGHLPGPGARAGTGRRRAARGRHRSRSTARHPLRGQGSVRRGGPADDRGHPPSSRQRAGRRLHRHRSVDTSRDGAARQDHHGAVRVRRRGHQHRSRNPPQPLASRAPPARWIELGHRRRGGGGTGPPRWGWAPIPGGRSGSPRACAGSPASRPRWGG